jgi:hypothetical protein
MWKNWSLALVEVRRGRRDVLIEAVTLISTSPVPGSGIGRVLSVTGFPTSVTNRAFCILRLFVINDVGIEYWCQLCLAE